MVNLLRCLHGYTLASPAIRKTQLVPILKYSQTNKPTTGVWPDPNVGLVRYYIQTFVGLHWFTIKICICATIRWDKNVEIVVWPATRGLCPSKINASSIPNRINQPELRLPNPAPFQYLLKPANLKISHSPFNTNHMTHHRSSLAH